MQNQQPEEQRKEYLIHELVEQFELQKTGVGPNDKAAKDARFNDDHQAVSMQKTT